VKKACEKLLSLGITGVHTSENVRSYKQLEHATEHGMVGVNTVRMLEVDKPGDIADVPGTSDVKIVKVLADGALGSQTACMLEPYCEQPDNLGIMAVPKPNLRRLVTASVEGGFAVAVHAIGDRANLEVLDVYEEVRATGPGRDALLRLEHAQVLRPDDIPRLGKLHVVASMQPIHLVGDMPVVDRYWGERGRYAYAFRSILDAGGVLAFGSDAPIEDPNPLRGIHAAVARRDPLLRGASAWHPHERITIFEAIDAYTIGAAVAAGTRDRTGSIRPGMRADLTVLDRDITACEPDALLDARVAMAVVNGRPHPGW
jgi:predicted amidohydrolase YtcJ